MGVGQSTDHHPHYWYLCDHPGNSKDLDATTDLRMQGGEGLEEGSKG